jgi:HAT1-interacting factor 1
MAEPTNEPLATVAESEELPKTKEKLDELTQAASLQYSLKNFSAAADHYADAVEIQAELNGETAPENAELLFYYGRALYKVAVAKSDVLGGKAAQEDKKKKKAKKETASSSAANGAKTESSKDTAAPKTASTYFQLEGDENWDTSDDEEDEEGGDAEEEDDFANAYEIFELARVAYQKQLDTLSESTGADKGKAPATLSPAERAIKEKLADCHGFLVEISLENERFHDAVADARSSLALQEEINSFEHENVTESHYSLSLALEFASVSKIREDNVDAERQQEESNADSGEDGINWDLRNEAAKHTQLAIDSLQARLNKEQSALASESTSLTDAQKKEKKAIIDDKKALLEELTGRLKELKQDPSKQTDFDSIDPSVVQGLFGSLLGADKTKQQEILKQATAQANDVSQVVRKKAKPAPKPVGADEGKGKRKLEVEGEGSGKRSKTEEPSS